MQHHYTSQELDERLAVARWWKWSRDEDWLGPVEARRHRRGSQAGLVSVDHGREEWWNLELPGVRDIPCASEVLLSQASEFYSCYFLEALKSSVCKSKRDVTFGEYMCVCLHACEIPHFFPFLSVRHVPLNSTQCHVTLFYSEFLCHCGNTSVCSKEKTNSYIVCYNVVWPIIPRHLL